MGATGGHIDTSGSTGSQVITVNNDVGIVVFLVSSQTSDGWDYHNNDNVHCWLSLGMASWGDINKGSINNGARLARYGAKTASDGHGSGFYDGYSIWLRVGGPTQTNTLLGYVTAMGSGSFTIQWTTNTAGYRVYYAAGPDQKSYADYGNALAVLSGLGSEQNGQAQGGIFFQGGIGPGGGGGNGTTYNNFMNSGTGFWASPADGGTYGSDHIGWNGGIGNGAYGYQADAHYEINKMLGAAGYIICYTAHDGIASSVIPGWSFAGPEYDGAGTVRYTAGGVGIGSPDGYFHGVGWATAENNSCSVNTPNITCAASAYVEEDLNSTSLVPDWGITTGAPIDNESGGLELGQSFGLWVNHGDGTYWNALIAAGNEASGGKMLAYRGTDYSWCSAFSLQSAGTNVTAGTIEYINTKIRYNKVVDGTGDDHIIAFFNGVEDELPQLYRWFPGQRP